jgi:hypothetical protein
MITLTWWQLLALMVVQAVLILAGFAFGSTK